MRKGNGFRRRPVMDKIPAATISSEGLETSQKVHQDIIVQKHDKLEFRLRQMATTEY